MSDPIHERPIIAVLGLGYVGLPLSLAFAQLTQVIGYDSQSARLAELHAQRPTSMEASSALYFTGRRGELSRADIFFLAVPTPVDRVQRPDLSYLTQAATDVASALAERARCGRSPATVVVESTVYPGVTEEMVVPLIENASGLRWKRDFFVGYSPERINPGDALHTLEQVRKVVAGDTAETERLICGLYDQIVQAGTYLAPSIRVAEAAKLIENTQRDLNIALMNELSVLFNRLGLDTQEVLDAASTKWNFVRYRPGLVGGHCIGVDPYYLKHKAEEVGYTPEVILAGRRVNDSMPRYIAQQIVKRLTRAGRPLRSAPISILGLTYKEDCSDVRNSRAADLFRELEDFGCAPVIHDPVASADAARSTYAIELTSFSDLPRQSEVVVLAVPHSQYLACSPSELLAPLRPGGLVVDVCSVLDQRVLKERGVDIFRL